MKRFISGFLTALLILPVCACARPGSAQNLAATTPAPTPATSATGTAIYVREDAEAAVYAAVIRQIYTHDDSFGGNLRPALLYVENYTDDRAGAASTQGSISKPIPGEIQTAVSALLHDLPARLNWASREDSRMPFILLGNIYPQPDGTLQVAGAIYIGNVGAQGQTYVLRYELGEWRITGTTGSVWMA